MKNFVLILASLFFVNHANASNAVVCAAITNDAAKQECMKSVTADEDRKESKDTCKASYDEYSTTKKEYIKTAKENKEKAEDKILELKKDLAEARAEAQEKTAEAEKNEEDAQKEFNDAKTALQASLDEFEKTTNEIGKTLVKEHEELVLKLEKSLTVDRDEVNTEYQNALLEGYTRCKQAAEADFKESLKITQDKNIQANQGYAFSGGASFASGGKVRKARAQAKKIHAECVTQTSRVLEAKRTAALQKMAMEEKRLNQEIAAKREEIDRITTKEHKKKLDSLNSELKSAEMALVSAQNKAAKDKQRLAAKLSADELRIENEITLNSARANGGLPPSDDPKDHKKVLALDEEVLEAKSKACNSCEKDGGGWITGAATALCKAQSADSKASKADRAKKASGEGSN